jgi:hypothetical protein
MNKTEIFIAIVQKYTGISSFFAADTHHIMKSTRKLAEKNHFVTDTIWQSKQTLVQNEYPIQLFMYH